jgi:hypothetical protein
MKSVQHPWPERKCKLKSCDDSTLLLLEWLSSRTQTIANIVVDVGQKEPSYTVN